MQTNNLFTDRSKASLKAGENLLIQRDKYKFSKELLIEFSKLEKLFEIQYINQSIENIGSEIGSTLVGLGITSAISHSIGENIEKLVKGFSKFTGEITPFVSFRIIDTRYFNGDNFSVSKDRHIDTSVFTLARAYTGKSTQRLAEKDVDRTLFKNTKRSKILVQPEKINIPVNNSDILLLTGEIRNPEDKSSQDFLNNFIDSRNVAPFNTGNGLVHRGPGFNPGDDLRTLLTINTFKKPIRLNR